MVILNKMLYNSRPYFIIHSLKSSLIQIPKSYGQYSFDSIFITYNK